jgi:glycerophosphoryl diester phosphodiesterase
MREIPIRGDTIRLGQLLKLAGVVASGAEAKAILADEEHQPLVNGDPESRRGRQLHDGDHVRVGGEHLRIIASPSPSPPPSRSVHRPLVIAHRGAWDPAPQNSLAAFERAIELGADGVELDVRRSGDDRLVIVHDPRVGVSPVSRLTATQLRERLAPGQAPDLEDVLAVLASHRALVDIELKEDGYVPQTMAAVARHLAPDRYVVTSFLDPVLAQVRAAAPRARTGLLLAARRPARTLERRVQQSGADFLALHTALARTGLLDFCARRGLPAWVWTANEPRLVRTLLADPRVEAIITDRTRDTVAQLAGS